MSLVKKDEYTLPGKGRLILTKDIIDQIDFLHDKVGGIEWCGILFYRHIEGDISKPSTLVLQAEHLYLMDIGSEAYTEADIDMDAVLEMDEVIPDVRNLKKGLIHTHHNMRAFFSGTDMSELHDSTPFHNYYLSLIVNFSGEYVAKVAYLAKKTSTVEYKNVKGEPQVATTVSEVLAMIDMDIEWETPEVVVSDFFRARHAKVKQEKEKKVQYHRPTYSPGLTYYTSGASQGARVADRPHYDWDAEQPGARTHPKQASIPFITEGGKLQVGDKQLRPKGEVEKDVREKVMTWLTNGVTEYTVGSTSDMSIKGMLDYLNDYFDFEDNKHNYPFFVNQMQRSMEDVFSGMSAGVVSKMGTDMLEGYEDNDLAVDLYAMLDSYPQYIATMADIKMEATGKSEFMEIYDKEKAKREAGKKEFKITKKV